ncbi:MAG: metal-dependent hydrolase [Puniceicoccales bacterium]
MDPLSQVTLGAAAAVALSRRGERGRAMIIGGLAGAVPDLDVLISSAEDPLLQLQYHRHFTHSIFMAPVIGVLVGVLLCLFGRIRSLGWGRVILFGVMGALTHGLLDACTSYGTQLLWPLSDLRVSWDVISIIDPIFTLPLLILLIVSVLRNSAVWVRCGLVLALVYLGGGWIQRERAQEWALQLAEARGHPVERVSARPSFANLVLWRTVYQSEGRYYVDAVNLRPGREAVFYPGKSVPLFSEADAEVLIADNPILEWDLRRFRHFSQGFLYRWPTHPEIVSDLRYSVFPDSVDPLWGVDLSTSTPAGHVNFGSYREVESGSFQRLWKMICGEPIPTGDQR